MQMCLHIAYTSMRALSLCSQKLVTPVCSKVDQTGAQDWVQSMFFSGIWCVVCTVYCFTTNICTHVVKAETIDNKTVWQDILFFLQTMWALWLFHWPCVCSVYQCIGALRLWLHMLFVHSTHDICGKRPVCAQVDTIHTVGGKKNMTHTANNLLLRIPAPLQFASSLYFWLWLWERSWVTCCLHSHSQSVTVNLNAVGFLTQ